MRGDRSAARAAFDSALVVADAAIRKAPDDWAVHHARGMALAGLGRRAEAHREVQFLRESKVYRDDAFFGPTVRLAAAEVLAHCGDAAGAVADLEQVLTEGAFGNILQVGITVHSLRMNPTWDPIREDPRFKALLARHSAEPHV
jgi:serine/threonine-protein kinase